MELSDVFTPSTVQFCPICFKKNSFDNVSNFVTHLKSCAFRNNITTEQLIKAIKLQEKQAIERIALGLPTVAKEKQKNIKKFFNKKVNIKVVYFLL